MKLSNVMRRTYPNNLKYRENNGPNKTQKKKEMN